MMDDASKAAIQELLDDCMARWRDKPPMIIHLSHQHMWVLMTACQLAHGMDGMPATGRKMFEEAGRQMQELVCDSVELYTFAENSWMIREEES